MSTLTPEEIEKIKAARDVVKQELEAAEAAGLIEERERTYFMKFREQFPEETALIKRFLDGRREVAERIDPLTCQYYQAAVRLVDPYGIWGNVGAIGNDLFVYDDQIDDDCVHSHDLSAEQWNTLRERIRREHPPAKNVIGYDEYTAEWVPPQDID